MLVSEKNKNMKIVAENKKAFFDYEILDRLEAGMVLTGDEVKSLRAKQASLKGSFAQFHQGELMLLNANIPVYKFAYTKKEDETTKSRKLLLHKREIAKLQNLTTEKGLTVIPLAMYLKHGFVKVKLGVARGKKAYDKRAALKKREHDRQIDRSLKDRDD